MASKEELTALEEAKESLQRIQYFDANSLVRREALGEDLCFEKAVKPAKRLIDLYRRLAISALDDFPKNIIDQIKNHAKNDLQKFENILDFKTTDPNAAQAHENHLNTLLSAYDASFRILHPFISYSLHKSADFQRLDSEARSTLKSIRDEAEEFTDNLKNKNDEASQILDEIRKVAAEQGVTQQAIYFSETSEKHENSSKKWLIATISISIVLGIYAFLTLFFHKWFAPQNTYETVQLAVSKVMIFAVISYMLYLFARNFLSHKHNAIINLHRQNALLTYQALVDAGGDSSNRDIVLMQAATCIFSPQCTGYTRDLSGNLSSNKSIIEFLTKPMSDGVE